MEKLEQTRLDALHGFFAESRVVTLVSHAHPDGDAVGSTTALCAWLQALGKDVQTILPTPPGDNIRFICEGFSPLVYTREQAACDRRLAASDLLVCLDFNGFSRTDAMEPALRAATARKVLIDHHLYPDEAAFDLCLSQTDISSASELLFWILLGMPEVAGDAAALPPRCAAALMAGMTTDTNNFANSVYPSTFEMASRLLAAGVDRDGIISALYHNYRENRIRLFGEMMKDRLRITPEGVALMFLPSALARRYDIREGETEGLVNQPLAISSVRMSVLVKEESDGTVRVSLRSKRGVSANRFAARFFHGGGHEMASGGKILVPGDVASIQEIEAYLADVSRQYMREEAAV